MNKEDPLETSANNKFFIVSRQNKRYDILLSIC